MGFLAVVTAYPRIIHDESELEGKHDYVPVSESSHHHQIEHEHAKSHQSIKFEYFDPVPVYIKKGHSHLLKYTLEKGKSESNLKLFHPETEHNHGGGLASEDGRQTTKYFTAHLEHGGFKQHQLSSDFKGYHSGEESKGYAELSYEPQAQGHTL